MSTDTIISVKNLDLYYGDFHALKRVPMEVQARRITALIGPSGCGKSTLLRTLNRMNDLIPGVRVTGSVLLEGKDIYALGSDVCALRKRVGMVFQRPNPFPLSIYDNVAFGLRVAGITNRSRVEEIVERSLTSAWLWDQLKDRLDDSALSLPLDQQQRLCVARLLAVEPEVILMDEPCSALDPIATTRIEELMIDLKAKYTIVIVTHNMQQAARISDFSGYMLLGEMIEFGDTAGIFTTPKDKRTQDYISGRYG
ncbi:MAG TPA: phosphate ABC transporter ATP-binding protein PstB [Kiritimatiellia bacterium]|nr:phosphate ABC transporter ATP-binding protein PstB [Kiritimatiellia bacterium]HPS08607.1 phosphate ABC transporter ATP-binding protein PstB [Kiritimatiellia bacterium]